MSVLDRFRAWLRRPDAAWVGETLLLVAGRRRRAGELRAEHGSLRLYACSPSTSMRATIVSLETLLEEHVRPARDGGKAWSDSGSPW